MKIIDTLKVLNRFKKKRVFKDYAIGGDVAIAYYLEPRPTDRYLEIFLLPDAEKLEKRFDKLGYDRDRLRNIIIKGVPVNIVPAYLPYEQVAVREAKVVKVGGIRTKILTPEYLIATKLHRSIFRHKNDGDISDLFKYQKVSMRKLENILSWGFKGQKRIDALERFFPDGLRVIRRYSPRDFTRLWKEQAKANERRRLEDIRLPFSKKLETIDFFIRVRGSNRRYRRTREKIMEAA